MADFGEIRSCVASRLLSRASLEGLRWHREMDGIHFVAMGRGGRHRTPAWSRRPPLLAEFVEPGWSTLSTSVRPGRPFTERNRVDDVPRRASAPRPSSRPSRKFGSGPLAGSILFTRDCVHPAGRLRSASGRHDRNHPGSAGPAPGRYVQERCAATADRGPDGYRGKSAFPGRSSCCRRGDGIRIFFSKQDGGRTVRMFAQAQHPPDRDL